MTTYRSFIDGERINSNSGRSTEMLCGGKRATGDGIGNGYFVEPMTLSGLPHCRAARLASP